MTSLFCNHTSNVQEMLLYIYNLNYYNRGFHVDGGGDGGGGGGSVTWLFYTYSSFWCRDL
jgi:hypothetical protein